ncbi:hypothetical protein BDY21DRAFT_333128 [Lineolata rhizophorae]|uniref:Uncharacterized protein n=1 Tax=Lineolata rhizophorae TaxID=578093 RepID=A0A6A6PCP6_9PEZI|nr:hypothetical protein BDY21DRAFT_333128 [Lineolata rhizophorae]
MPLFSNRTIVSSSTPLRPRIQKATSVGPTTHALHLFFQFKSSVTSTSTPCLITPMPTLAPHHFVRRVPELNAMTSNSVGVSIEREDSASELTALPRKSHADTTMAPHEKVGRLPAATGTTSQTPGQQRVLWERTRETKKARRRRRGRRSMLHISEGGQCISV